MCKQAIGCCPRRTGQKLPIQFNLMKIHTITDPRAMVQAMVSLASASLAWNEAIRATPAKLGSSDDLVGLYSHAFLASLVATVMLKLLDLAGELD